MSKMNDVKVQFVAGRIRTDMRGGNLIGKAEGDHHDTALEFRVDEMTAQALIEALTPVNQRYANALGALLDVLEAHIPGSKGKALKAMGFMTGENIEDAAVIGVQARVYDQD
jgi:hypothetical protein